MTREEAIKIINCYDIGFYDLSGEKIPADKLADAFDMAIEALSTPSGDLISRADAIGAVQDHFNDNGFRGYNDGQKMMDRIEALPSAEAEHDGCDGCRYEHNTEYEYPCSECKQTYKDMWEQKPNDFIDVVRCKDCKYSFYDKDYESYNCRKHEYVELFDADDYCSWGERND